MKSVSKVRGAVVLAVLIGAGSWWLSQQERASDRQAPPSAGLPAVGEPSAHSVAPASSSAGVSTVSGIRTIPAPRPSVSAEFDLWADKFIAAATPQLRDALLEEGRSLALTRRDRMVELIEEDPERALQSALPYRVRKQLPPEIKALVEESVSGRGSFTPIHAKALPGREAEVEDTTYRVVLNGWSYDAYTYGRRAVRPARKGHALNGVALVDKKHRRVLALSDSPFRVLESEEAKDRVGAEDAGAHCAVCARSAAQPTRVDFGGKLLSFCHSGHAEELSRIISAGEAGLAGGGSLDFTAASFAPASTTLPPGGTSFTQGIKKLLLIPTVLADDPRPVTSEDQMQRVARDNNQYYVDGSYGTASFLTTTTPQITLPGTRSFYNEYLGMLFPDAVNAAYALGYTDDYDHIYMIFPSIPGVQFGGRSDGLIHAGIGLGVLAHELGHNFGLPHGLYWDSSGRLPGPVQPRNPPPGPYPIDSDGLTGHDDINAPAILNLGGRASPAEDYGNIYDVMGSGDGHFCVAFKYGMNWLPEQFVPVLGVSSTNRVYAFDTPSISDGRTYGLRIRKNTVSTVVGGRLFPKTFWVSHREGYPNNPWMVNGVEILWDNALLDTTPTTAAGKQDAAVVIGRTFSDPESHIHITPIAKGGGPSASDKWVDVVTQIGPFPDNQPPVFTLTATEVNLPLGGTVTFTATATDPDGDALAYNWDFGAGRFGLNQPEMTRTFTDVGHYVVRCEVSDMKGGVARANVLVTVGVPSTFTMSGRVVDDLGNPLSGVRVHNNAAVQPFFNPGPPEDPVVPVQPPSNGPAYRFGYTDDDGYYIIGNVPAGTFTNRAFIYGYRSEPQFVNPVVMQSGDAGNLDHVAFRIPKISIEKEFDCADESNSGSFLFRRDGDTSAALQVLFAPGGNAVQDVDYEGFRFITTNVVVTTTNGVSTTNLVVTTNLNVGAVTFPAGVDMVSLPVVPIGNGDGDGGKDVLITLMLQTNDFRVSTTLTNVVTTNSGVLITNTVLISTTNRIRIPGWELLPDGPDAELTWFQTYPTYVLGTAEARVRILDDDPAGTPLVGVAAVDSDAMETRGDSAMLVFFRTGAPTNAPLLVRYTVTGTASNGLDYVSLPGTVTIPAGSQALFHPVVALRDELVEGREEIIVAIEDPGDGSYSGAGIGSVVYIIDDDLPLVSIYSTDSIANKSGNPGSVTLSRTGDLTESLLVNYLSSGTATGGVDYAILPGSVVIPAGQVTATIAITPLNNPNAVGPRQATILLSDSPAYNVSPLNAATVVINDNLPVVTLQVTSSTPSESGVTGVFTFTRTGPVTNQLTVNFVVGGSAYEGIDYSPIGTNVTFAIGVSSVTVTIVASPDSFNEFGEINGHDDVILQLLAGPGYLVGSPSSGVVTLANDDGSQLPAVGFLLRNSTWREGELATIAARISFNPETNRPARGTAVVDYRVTSGSAIPNVNYVPNSGSLTFTHYEPPNPPVDSITAPLLEGTIRTIQLQTLLDNLPSGTKTLTLQLFNPAGYETNLVEATNGMGQVVGTNIVITKIITNAFLGPYSTHTVTILDVETNVLSVAATLPLAYEEGLVPGQFTITRTGNLTRALKVDFSVTGTAASGSDFVALAPNSSVIIPAGTNAVVVPVFPLDDPQQESAESVTLTLLPRPGVTVGGSATVVVVDNDGTIQFSLPQYVVSEGVGTGMIQVERTGATNRTVVVDYVIAPGTALLDTDYQTTNGTVTFLPGDMTKMISVPILEDSLVEPRETFSVTLTGTSGGVPLGGQNETVVVIEDNDTAFDFSAPTFSAAENSTNASITVRRYGVVTNAVSVTLETTNGTAAASDYVGTNLVLNFSAGQTNYEFSLRILDDVITESNETVLLSLLSPSANTQLGNTNTATLTIVEDECRIEFTASTYAAKEYLGQVTVNVQRIGGTVNDVTVNFDTALGTAGALDLVTASGTLTFRGDHYEPVPDGSGDQVFVPGDTNLGITIQLFDDTIGEINETFIVGLSGLTGPVLGSATFGSVTNTTVTIIDNEGPGNVDFEFNPGTGANGPVRAVALQAEGRIVFGGDFTAVDGIELRRVARLQADGFLDPSFAPGNGIDGPVYAVAVQPDNRILVAGNFTNVDSATRLRVARLNSGGNIDPSFTLTNAADQTVRALALQTNGQILIGGDFQTVAGFSRRGIARLNSDGTIDSNFSPIINGSVRALAVQTDGKILVGGIFTNVAGFQRPFLARLTSAGAIDPTFTPGTGPNGPIHALALQGDGRILVGGAFTSYGGTAQPYLARLNVDGTVDGTFDTGTDVNGVVYSVGIHSNGRITIGGEFTSVDGAGRNRFARLRSTGALDTAFDPGSGANSNVLAVAVQPNTAIVIGGEFTTVDGLSRNRIARIHGEERSDLIRVEFAEETFRVPEEGGMATVTVVRSGNTNAAFSISYATAPGSASDPADYTGTAGGTLNFVANEVSKTVTFAIANDSLLEGDEALSVYLFNFPANGDNTGITNATLVIQDNERVVQLATNAYSAAEGQTNALIAVVRLGGQSGAVAVNFATSDGSALGGQDFVSTNGTFTLLDGETNKAFRVPLIDNFVQNSAKTFTVTLSAPSNATLGAQISGTVTILDDEIPGNLDRGFSIGSGANGLVRALALQSDGKILVGGAFTTFGGVTNRYITRLQTNGSPDLSFQPNQGANGLVSAVAALPGNRVVLAGSFDRVNTVTSLRIARMLENGSLDPTFVAPTGPEGLNAAVTTVAVLDDGKLFVGGGFSVPSQRIGRLALNGSVDASFSPGEGANGIVQSISLQPDGSVIVGGAFSAMAGLPRSRVAKLNGFGQLDTDFGNDPVIASGTVYGSARQSDGRIVVVGDFTLVDGLGSTRIARLNTDGSLDTTFNVGVGANAIVYAVGVQANDKILIAGDFSTVGGMTRGRIARLEADGSLDTSFDPGTGANATVYTLLVQPDDNLLIGGAFTSVSGQPRGGLARIFAGDSSVLQLTDFDVVPGGNVTVTFTAIVGRTYVLEVTSDLVSWNPVVSTTATTTTVTMTDPDPANLTQRFYRVREQ